MLKMYWTQYKEELIFFLAYEGRVKHAFLMILNKHKRDKSRY